MEKVMLNRKQTEALATVAGTDTARVWLQPWNDYGAVMVEVREHVGGETLRYVLSARGDLLPWTGSIADLAGEALDAAERAGRIGVGRRG